MIRASGDSSSAQEQGEAGTVDTDILLVAAGVTANTDGAIDPKAGLELDRKRITQAHDHFIKDVVRELIIRFGDRNSGTPDPTKHIVGVSVAMDVVQELRDAGVLGKYYKKVRRAQDLVLWSTLGAGNYNYIMEYSFRGDGTITCRMGSTGQNFGNHETTGHMHHACWRIDLASSRRV